MNKKCYLLLVVALVMVMAWSTSAFAWTVQNHPHNNNSQTAYDAAKILRGYYDITDAITGTSADRFLYWDVYYHMVGVDTFTIIKWWGGEIDSCETAAMCYDTRSGKCPKEMTLVWTDSLQQIIGVPQVVVTNCNSFDGGNHAFALANDWHAWDGAALPPAPGDGAGVPMGPIEVTNLAYTVIDVPYPMEQIDSSLFDDPGLDWISLGNHLIDPGEEVEFDIGPIPPGKFVLFGAEIEGGGTHTWHFGEFSTSEDIPTLSEWAMIIFAVVIMALMTYVVVRRRRSVQPTTA